MSDGAEHMESIDRYVANQRRRNGSTSLVLPKPTRAELRDRRVKLLQLPIATIIGLLTMNGDYALAMDGWPEGARVIAGRMVDRPMAMVELVLYHPEFPPVLIGSEPGRITITARRVV